MTSYAPQHPPQPQQQQQQQQQSHHRASAQSDTRRSPAVKVPAASNPSSRRGGTADDRHSASPSGAPRQTPRPRLRRNAPLHARDRSRPGLVLVIPSADVHQLPDAFAADGKLYVCPHYRPPPPPSDPANAEAAGHNAGTSCVKGETCSDVHARLDSVNTYTAHERSDAWKTLSDIPYPVFPPSLGNLEVANANAKDSLVPIFACACLRTGALDAERRPLSHCAHFRSKGVCDLGENCQFIHAVEHLLATASPSSSQMRSPAAAAPPALVGAALPAPAVDVHQHDLPVFHRSDSPVEPAALASFELSLGGHAAASHTDHPAGGAAMAGGMAGGGAGDSTLLLDDGSPLTLQRSSGHHAHLVAGGSVTDSFSFAPVSGGQAQHFAQQQQQQGQRRMQQQPSPGVGTATTPQFLNQTPQPPPAAASSLSRSSAHPPGSSTSRQTGRLSGTGVRRHDPYSATPITPSALGRTITPQADRVGTPSASTTPSRRFRHDPYSLNGSFAAVA